MPPCAPSARIAARRAASTMRATRSARIVLAASQAWDWLSADDHQLLAQQPAPHGALFAWLEGQWLEHGPQPWAAVREALRGQAFEALALELHSGGMVLEQAEAQTNTPAEAVDPTDPSGVRSELRELLRLLHIERLMQIENELIAHAETDAGQMQRYREVTAQRKILQNSKP